MPQKTIKVRKSLLRTSVRPIDLPRGLPTPEEIHAELQHMFDVLLGRKNVPMSGNYLDLMEIADAYYMRASELTFLIHALERKGTIARGSAYNKLRTGELEDFREACKRATDLGSRRLSQKQLEYDQTQSGLSSAGWEDKK